MAKKIGNMMSKKLCLRRDAIPRRRTEGVSGTVEGDFNGFANPKSKKSFQAGPLTTSDICVGHRSSAVESSDGVVAWNFARL